MENSVTVFYTIYTKDSRKNTEMGVGKKTSIISEKIYSFEKSKLFFFPVFML